MLQNRFLKIFSFFLCTSLVAEETDCLCSQGGVFLTADYLYWSPSEDGLEYAREVQVVSAAAAGFSPSASSLSTTYSVNGSWSSGVRAGVGYLFGNMDHWDLYANWTYFLNHSQDSHGNPGAPFNPSHYFAPIWHPFLGQRSSAASEHWTLHYNTLDLEFGKEWRASRYFSLRPHAGLRAAWIDQDINSSYTGAWPLAGGFAERSTSLQIDNDCKGIGIRAGTDTRFHFARDWSVLGQFSGAILYGKFDVTQTIQGYQQLDVGAVPTAYSNTKNTDEHSIIANLQLFLGIEWKTLFKQGKYSLSFGAGYEFLEWFHQNKASQTLISVVGDGSENAFTSETTENGNLGLQGLTVKGRFDF